LVRDSADHTMRDAGRWLWPETARSSKKQLLHVKPQNRCSNEQRRSIDFARLDGELPKSLELEPANWLCGCSGPALDHT
jgi:hypothetical protein